MDELHCSKFYYTLLSIYHMKNWGFYGRAYMVVEFTTVCAISAYHHLYFEFEPYS